MKKVSFAFLLVVFTIFGAQAGRYYWVGGSGNWSDTSHWATNSGGAVFYSVLPGITDTVFFDANSFSANGKVVRIDTTKAFCAMMDWTGIAFNAEFNSDPTDTLSIYGSLLLSDKVTFNVAGYVRFMGTTGITEIDTRSKTLKCNIQLAADTMFLSSKLLLPYNRLLHTDGSFDANGHRVACRHFNTDTTLLLSVPIANPRWFNADSLTVTGSFAIANTITFVQTGPLYFQYSTLDSNYINMYGNMMICDVFMTGSKKMFLLSQFHTAGKLEFKGGGNFISQNNVIDVESFQNTSSLTKTINLGTSTVHLRGSGNALYMTDVRLNLLASAASFVFDYSGSDSVRMYLGSDSLFHLGSVDLPVATSLIYSSFRTNELTILPSSNVLLAHGIELTLDTISAAGDCGHYIFLSSFCSECPSCGSLSDCPSDIPTITSIGGNIVVNYFKLAYSKVQGATFTANNSFNQGNLTGWTVNEPATTGTLYWIGGSGNWDNPTHWSLLSGGGSWGCIPVRGTSVVFDAASFSSDDTVAVDDIAYCHAMSWTNPDFLGYLSGEGIVYISDSLLLHDSTNIVLSQGLELMSALTDTISITSRHAEIESEIRFNGFATWMLSDTLHSNSRIFVEKGLFNLNKLGLVCDAIELNGNVARTLNYNNSLIALTGKDTVWNSAGSNLTLQHDSGVVAVLYPGSDLVLMNVAGVSFDTISITASRSRIAGGGSSALLAVAGSASLEFEPSTVWSLDSLVIGGDCQSMVSLGSYSGSTDTAQIVKLGYDTLNIAFVTLRNITADTVGGKQYNAASSYPAGVTNGWTFTAIPAGATYFWKGMSSTAWNDVANWEVNALPATCLPAPTDTVVFNEANLLAATHDTVVVNRNSAVKVMDWSGIVTAKPVLQIGADLQISDDVFLNDSLTLEYTAGFSSNDANPPALYLTTAYGHAEFDPSAFKYSVNTFIAGQTLVDTVFMIAGINTDSTVLLSVNSGTFISNENSIEVGVIRTQSNTDKELILRKSDITVKYIAEFQSSPILTLDADSTTFVMPGNSSFSSYFDGGSQQFFDLEMNVVLSDSATATYSGKIYGSNTFHFLKTDPGMHWFFEASTTQTTDSLIAFGTCQDSIYIATTNSGTQATIACLSGDSIRTQCTVVKDIVATSGAAAVFSWDEGNNVGWAFNIDKATYASFTLPLTTCFGDSLQFTNTSTAFSGNQGDLTFEWDFGDDSSSVAVSPNHLYNNYQEYIVSLTSTYIINGCQDTYIDTVTVFKPIISLSTSETDTTICNGDQVTFTAISPNDSPSYVFYTGGFQVVQSPDSVKYRTDSLTNGEQVFVVLTYQGCIDTSHIYTFFVNPLPVVSLSSSDFDLTICDGDSVTLTAAGANKYELFLNGLEYSILDTLNQWQTDTISDTDEFTLYGKNTSTGCYSYSSDSLLFSVLPLPIVTLTVSDADTTICAGDTVVAYASGAAAYLFYLNSVPIGIPSATDSIVLPNLVQGDIVTVEGYSIAGCRNFSSGYLDFTVEVTPLLTLTSSDPDGIICAGESITFQASGASQFQFFVDGASTGAFDVNNSLDSTFTNGQTVAVQGLLGNCSAWADTVFTIDVRPTITWSFSANEICANDTILLEADGDTVYQYHIDGTPVTALQYDSVYHATGLTDGQIITVTGTTGACTPSQLLVTVHPVPLVDVVCSDPDTAICQGDNIAFTASGSEQYAFFVNGSIVGPYTTVPTFSSTGINNGDVVTMQSNTSFGCHSFSSDTFTVEVAPYPVVSMTQTDLDQIICNGDSVVFNASGANLYEFFITGTSQGAASITDSLVAGALSNGDVVTVRGTTGYCSATSTDVYNFTVNAIPNISFTPLSGLLFCNGDTVKLLAGGATSYQFYVDGSPYGSVTGNSVFSSSTLITGQTVSVDGYLLGCVGSSDTAYTLTVNNYPVLVFNNNQPTGIICYGDTVVFEGLGAQTYSFYIDGMSVSNDSVYSIANLQNGQAVTLFGANGVCGLWADSTMVIQVNYVDVELTTDAIASSICSGTQVEFTASGADEYEFFIDGVSTGAPSASNVYQSSTLTNGQIVSVEGTSTTLGCSQQAFSDFYIHVLDVPTVSVSPSNHFCEGDSAMLSSSVATGNLWYLDGSVFAGESNPSFWVYDQGTYTTSSTSGAANRVLSCGDNSEGQFGDGTTLNSPAMMQSLLSVDAANLSCGEQFTLVLCADGSVRAWGRNEFGALGNGNYSDSEVPVQVGSINNAIKVVAGNRFGLALLADSTVVAWGENTFGQLGYGNYSTSNFPFAVVGLDSVIDIAAGENHAIALTANGKVWAWGRNQAGQLGDSTLVTRNAPVVVKNISNVVAVGCGANHSMALKSDGSLQTWGSNSSGQLGTGNLISALTPTKVHFFNKISSFDGGFAHSLACDTAGFLYSWGSNTFGQLGKAVISESLFPVYPDANGNIKQVKAGKYSSYALRSDSNLLVWGFNTSAQLGLQTTTNVFTPEIVDQAFAVAAFDGGGNHLSVIPSATHSCTSLGVVITVDTVPSVNLNVNGLVLSTNTVGVSYQWYYNGSEIPGATGTSISISAWGSYYVVVTFANGCSGFSDEYQYGVGFDEYNNGNQLSIYPNPGNGHFFVTISGNENAVSWKIYNMLGSVVASSDNLVPTSVFEVDGFDIQPGVYSIQVISGSNSVLTGRFVVND